MASNIDIREEQLRSRRNGELKKGDAPLTIPRELVITVQH